MKRGYGAKSQLGVDRIPCEAHVAAMTHARAFGSTLATAWRGASSAASWFAAFYYPTIRAETD
jgi:hypothetical protein